MNPQILALHLDRRVEVEERAAIMEYDGGLSRAEAEREALRLEIRDGLAEYRNPGYTEASNTVQVIGKTCDE